MKKLTIILIMLLFCGMTVAVQADEPFSKVATSMAQFLKMQTGARGAAMGGANAAATEDVYAMAWNPAGIGHIKQPSFAVSYLSYFADINYSYVGFAMPIDGSSSFGVSANFIGTDPIEITTIEQPNGTGTYYDYSGFVMGASYSRWLTDRLTVGVTVKMIQENIYREQASTFAFDIGSQFDTGLSGIRLAMCITNFGGKMKLDGPDINVDTDTNEDLQGNRDTNAKLYTADWPIPMIFRMGLMVDVVGGTNEIVENSMNRLTLVADANDPVDHNLRSNIGVEYAWQETFFLRAGHHINYDEDTLGFTAGAGVLVNAGKTKIGVDYAFQDFGLLGGIHHYSLSLQF